MKTLPQLPFRIVREPASPRDNIGITYKGSMLPDLMGARPSPPVPTALEAARATLQHLKDQAFRDRLREGIDSAFPGKHQDR